MPDGWDGELDLKRVRDETHRAAADGLQQALERVLERSNADVPYQTGDLRRSGRVSVDRRTLEGAVSYDTDYAVEVHEDMSRHHPHGRAKFLEHAMNELRPEIVEATAAAIRRAWGT